MKSGQLGIFTNGYWGHPAYKLPPEANLMAVAHYLEALDWQRDVIRVHTIFGGKNPHPNFLVGGMASAINLDDTGTINAESFTKIQDMIPRARQFVEQVYWPDLQAIASFYPEWASIGGGVTNYMSCGEWPENGQWQRQGLAVLPGRRDLRPQPVGGDALRSGGDRRSTSTAPGTSTRAATTSASAPLGRRDDAALHRSPAAVDLPPGRGEVHLDEGAAVLGPPGGGRAPGPDARSLRVGAGRRAGHRQRHARRARRRTGGALLDARPHGGARHRDRAPRAQDGGLVQRAGGAREGRRRSHVQRRPLGALDAGPPRREATACSRRRGARWATGC